VTNPPPYPPYPPYPSAPRPRPDVGRAGCLAASLSAAPFFLLALGCLVLAVAAFNDPSPRPRPPRQSTTIPGTAPGGTTSVAPRSSSSSTDPVDGPETTDPDGRSGGAGTSVP